MFKHPLVILMLCCSVLAHAQKAGRSPEREQVQQQRRADVRSIAQDKASDIAPGKDSAPAQRQLGPQERAELRQQLRQQRRDNPKQ